MRMLNAKTRGGEPVSSAQVRGRPAVSASLRSRGPVMGENVLGLLLVLPALLVLAVVKFYPLFLGVRTSFTDASPSGSRPIGLANYRAALHDPVWHQALLNSAKGLIVLPFFVLVPLLLAYLLHQKVNGWRTFRTIFFLSNLLPTALIGLIFALLLSARGPWSSIGRTLHLGAVGNAPTSSLTWSIYAVYAVALWAVFGFGVLTYLAGMTAIPDDLYFAARVDGAGMFRQFFAVTLPSIMPTLVYWTVVSTAGLLLWLFPIIYTLTGGGPGYASTTPEVYIWRVFGEQLRYGYASALGLMLFAGVLVFMIGQVWWLWTRTGDAE